MGTQAGFGTPYERETCRSLRQTPPRETCLSPPVPVSRKLAAGHANSGGCSSEVRSSAAKLETVAVHLEIDDSVLTVSSQDDRELAGPLSGTRQ